MPRPHRLALACVSTLAAAVLSGCATIVTGTPTADPAPRPAVGVGSDPVVWADKVCGAVLAYIQPARTAPVYDGADLPGIRQRLSDYLGATVNGLQQSRDQLAAVGAAPVASGDQTVTTVSAGLEKLQAEVSAAKAKVDTANPDDVEGFKNALGETQESLSKATAPDVLGQLATSPRLNKAAQQAANCQQLPR